MFSYSKLLSILLFIILFVLTPIRKCNTVWVKQSCKIHVYYDMISYEFNHFTQPTVRPLLRFPEPSYKMAPQQRERSVSTFVTRIPRKRVSQKPNASLMERGPPSVCTVDVSFLTKISTSDFFSFLLDTINMLQ